MQSTSKFSIEKGEEIIHMLISSYIPGTGVYKFLSKQKEDKSFAWIHFVERENGSKENFYSGETKIDEELQAVVGIMNRILIKTFGPVAEMKPGKTEVSTIIGTNDVGTIN
jgi:hypothetical protein